MTPAKLADQIRDVRYRHGGDPFDLFVVETMREIGIPVREDPPSEEVAEEVRPLTQAYLEMAHAAPEFEDILGPTYMAYREGAKAFAGQFFTPPDVCRMMVEMTLGDWEPRPHPEGGLWRLLEPACGSGAMLLAAYHHLLQRHGPEALRLWYSEAWDVDRTLARTCALQVLITLARHNWALGEIRVIHGDTLRMEVRSVVLHAEAAPQPVGAPGPASALGRGPGRQLSLFGDDTHEQERGAA
ncbi:N-6 DNA methylase [Thioalkalivibrio sp.]|uniref:N-6 DNA methylase n=1 Tax=Thioalkalivibrio sp. TaxID=2093813 RepID=UPI0035642B8E